MKEEDDCTCHQSIVVDFVAPAPSQPALPRLSLIKIKTSPLLPCNRLYTRSTNTMASSRNRHELGESTTDNLHSPANFAFYETSLYRALTLVPYHIRLLKVRRDAEKKSFRYELTNGIPLREVVGEYTAISYYAGDPNNTLEIIVDGKPSNAFANLVQAIEETCRYLPNHGDSTYNKVLIWADQSKHVSFHTLGSWAE